MEVLKKNSASRLPSSSSFYPPTSKVTPFSPHPSGLEPLLKSFLLLLSTSIPEPRERVTTKKKDHPFRLPLAILTRVFVLVLHSRRRCLQRICLRRVRQDRRRQGLDGGQAGRQDRERREREKEKKKPHITVVVRAPQPPQPPQPRSPKGGGDDKGLVQSVNRPAISAAEGWGKLGGWGGC